jgi:arylsulfatase A-like enzyme
MRPNVLLITADQWRADCVGYRGHPVRTPAIDALARRGTAFLGHFVQAAPCSPSRACLYTGLHQMTNRVVRNGTPLDARHDTLALAMRRAGYDPTLFGYTDQAIDPRTTSGDDPRLFTYEGVLPGFTTRVRLPEDAGPWLSWLRGRGHAVPDDPWDIYLPRTGPADRPVRTPPIYGADETETAFLTGEVLRWLTEQRPDRPWFAHVSYLRPHPPFVVPEPFNEAYSGTEGAPPKRQADAAAEAAVHPLVDWWHRSVSARHMVVGRDRRRIADWTDDDIRTVRALYFGMVEEVDRQIGRLIAGLEASGMAGDTVVVLTSDHGEELGDRFTLGKFGFYDESYHVPLIVCDPRRPASHGRSVEAFTAGIDLMPTVLDLAGAAVPAHLDGRSLAPLLDGPGPADWRDFVAWEYDFREVAKGTAQRHFGLPMDALSLAVLRTKRWKYVHFAALPPLLFDLDGDPDELADRAADPACARVRLEMAERMLSWRAANLDRTLTGIELTADGPVDGRR